MTARSRQAKPASGAPARKQPVKASTMCLSGKTSAVVVTQDGAPSSVNRRSGGRRSGAPGRAHAARGRGARADRRGPHNAEIAEALVVSAATVKSHVNHIFAKAGVRDRAQAVVYAYANGLATSSRER